MYEILSVILLCVVKGISTVRLYSPDDSDLAVPLSIAGMNIENITSLTFKVKACANAHVLIQKNSNPNLYAYGNYGFAIGSYGNTRAELIASLHGARFPPHHPEVLLSCTEYRPFWVSWEGGVLKIGKGEQLSVNEMLSSSVSSTSGYKYAFVLSGWGSNACWQIDSDKAILKYRTLKTSGNKKLSGNAVKESLIESRLKCSQLCITPSEDLPCGCQRYSYNSITKQCLVIEASQLYFLVDQSGWNTWSLQPSK